MYLYVLQTNAQIDHKIDMIRHSNVALRVYRTDRYINLSWLLRAESRRELINYLYLMYLQ